MNAKEILSAFGGAQQTDLESRLLTYSETNRRIRIAQMLVPRTPEQIEEIKRRSRILTAVMTAKLGKISYISNSSGLVRFIQIAPVFGQNSYMRFKSGTECWRLCDVRMRVSELIPDPNDDTALIPDPDPTHFIRMGFSVNKSRSFTPPAWTITIRPVSVTRDYASRSNMWLPRDTNETRILSNAETDYMKRRALWGAVWAPYTDLVGKVVTACVEMIEKRMDAPFWMGRLARNVEEENETLTPVQGFDGDKVYLEEIIPNLEKLQAEADAKLEEMVALINAGKVVPNDTESAYDAVSEN